MSKNLPARSRSASLPEFPRILPSDVRAKARSGLLDDMETLQWIIDDPEQKGNVRVSAVKLKATIGGVLGSSSIPRDVVEEKIGETALYLRRKLGDEVFATLAEDLTDIWNV